MKQAGTFLLSILRNKWFWVLLAAVVVLLLVRANWNRIKALFTRDFGNYDEGFVTPTGSGQEVDARQRELEALAQTTYAAIHGTPGAFGASHVDVLKALNDTELKFTATYYRQAITRGTKLSVDIDDEVLPFTDEESLVARLQAMNE